MRAITAIAIIGCASSHRIEARDMAGESVAHDVSTVTELSSSDVSSALTGLCIEREAGDVIALRVFLRSDSGRPQLVSHCAAEGHSESLLRLTLSTETDSPFPGPTTCTDELPAFTMLSCDVSRLSRLDGLGAVRVVDGEGRAIAGPFDCASCPRECFSWGAPEAAAGDSSACTVQSRCFPERITWLRGCEGQSCRTAIEPDGRVNLELRGICARPEHSGAVFCLGSKVSARIDDRTSVWVDGVELETDGSGACLD